MVDGDETGQRYSTGARCSIRYRLDLNIALEHWSCLPVALRALWSSSPVPKPLSGVRLCRAAASFDLMALELMERDQTLPRCVLRRAECELQFSGVSVRLCKCDDMLGRCYCEERETELGFHPACLSSG